MRTQKFLAVILATIFASTLNACGSVETKSSTLKIVSGVAATLDDAVARHTLAMVKSQTDQGTPYCSAVLIGQDQVLTAAHCISSEEDPIYFALGLGLSDSLRPTIRRGMAIIHPEFRTGTDQMTYNDIALVNLTDNIANPAHMKPATLADINDFAAGSKVILAGYGSLGYREGAGFISNRAVKLYQTSTVIDRFDDNNSNLIIYKSPDEISSACAGDSGGPMFIESAQGDLQVIGVTRGPVLGDANSLRCRGRGTYTNAAFLRDFVGR